MALIEFIEAGVSAGDIDCDKAATKTVQTVRVRAETSKVGEPASPYMVFSDMPAASSP